MYVLVLYSTWKLASIHSFQQFPNLHIGVLVICQFEAFGQPTSHCRYLKQVPIHIWLIIRPITTIEEWNHSDGIVFLNSNSWNLWQNHFTFLSVLNLAQWKDCQNISIQWRSIKLKYLRQYLNDVEINDVTIQYNLKLFSFL